MDAPLELYVGLKYLMEKQRPALERLGHYATDKQTIQTYAVALQIEVSEFINELNWKPWKEKKADLDRVTDEFADCLHFIGSFVNILNLMGLSPEILAKAFQRKWDENQRRFDGQVEYYGVPGVSAKDAMDAMGEASETLFSTFPTPYSNGNGDIQLAFSEVDEAVAVLEEIRDIQQEDWNPKPGGILRDPMEGAEEEGGSLDDD